MSVTAPSVPLEQPQASRNRTKIHRCMAEYRNKKQAETGVQSGPMETCLFCGIAKREIPSKMVLEDDRVFAFHDIKPVAPVHVLICPRQHIATLNDVSAEDTALVGYMFEVARKIAEQFGVAQSGYRTVFNCNADAGQAVFHIHLHVLGGRKLAWPPG